MTTETKTMCHKCGEHEAVVNDEGELLCGTCSVEKRMNSNTPSIRTTQQYRAHHESRKPVGDALVSFCDCSHCDFFRLMYPTVAAKIEADIFFRVRRGLLIMLAAADRKSA